MFFLAVNIIKKNCVIGKQGFSLFPFFVLGIVPIFANDNYTLTSARAPAGIPARFRQASQPSTLRLGFRPDTRPVFRSRPDGLPEARHLPQTWTAAAPEPVLTVLFFQMPQEPGKKILPYFLPVDLIEQLVTGVLIKAQGNIPAACV